jgi:Ca2+-binding RTX toxin-like protein
MSRTIRTGIDQLGGYVLLAGPEFTIPPLAEDYIELPYNLQFAQSYPITTITVWGTGLISFGPATAEQMAFMANVGSNADLSTFPGDYVAIGFSAAQYSTIEAILFNSALTGPWFRTTNGSVTISDEGLKVSGANSGGLQTGWSIDGQSAHSGEGMLYWSDLSVISGTNGSQVLNGTDYAETLRGLGGDDVLNGGLGADALEGGSGNDVLNGGGGHDRLWGGTGDDILNPGTDFRFVDGGSGFDRLFLDYSGSGTSLGLDAAHLLSGPSVVGVEAVHIVGTSNVDVIEGTASNDRLFGGAGFDFLSGGDGNDFLDAGLPGSSVIGAIPNGGQTVADSLSLDYLFASGTDGATLSTRVTYVPHLLFDPTSGMEVYSFTVTNPGAELWLDWNIIQASAGGSGTFTLLVTDANGIEVERGNYDPAVPYVFPHAGTYYLTASLFSGSSWEYGYLDLDLRLEGGLVLTANRLAGGNGDDTYVVYSASDQIVEGANAGNDIVLSSTSFVLPANVERLTLTGSAGLSGTGSGDDNIITGNSGANILTGGDGSDRLIGGNGSDIFAFGASELGTTRTGEHDAIIDFRSQVDRIDLTALYSGHAFGGLTSGRAADAATLSGYKALTFTEKGTTWLVGDTDGIAGADFAIELSGIVKLKPSDLIVDEFSLSAAASAAGYYDLI